ncbi:MAG: hypothetical protein ACE5I1_19985 [bacterium]
MLIHGRPTLDFNAGAQGKAVRSEGVACKHRQNIVDTDAISA